MNEPEPSAGLGAPYVGPPPSTPPPPGWRLPIVVQAPAPRELPKQDQRDIDDREQTARTLTYGVAMVAGSITVLLLLVICGRVLF